MYTDMDYVYISSVWYTESAWDPSNSVTVSAVFTSVDMQLVLKDVAYMSKDGLQFSYLENESNVTLWPDGIPPLLRVQTTHSFPCGSSAIPTPLF